MKYAIMSDVHANPAVLETALADARALGCEKFVMLGDITGYGYDANRAQYTCDASAVLRVFGIIRAWRVFCSLTGCRSRIPG